MKRGGVERTWSEFERRIGEERKEKGVRGGKKKRGGERAVPRDLCIQRMSSVASGRLKKYEPLDTRDFVPFADFDELTLENIKTACERFYQAPPGSCDVLASDRGPSCTDIEQVKNKKFYLVRFLQPKEPYKRVSGNAASVPSPEKKNQRQAARATARSVFTPPAKVITPNKTVFPKSVSISELLKAGKLVKPKAATDLELEQFNIQNSLWVNFSTLKVVIEEKEFDSGTFRNAFLAKPSGDNLPHLSASDWVIKKYNQAAITSIIEDLKISIEDHTRKKSKCTQLRETLLKGSH